MIRGIGVDVADAGRFRSAVDLPGILGQVLTGREIAGTAASRDPAAAAARLFAVKEAVVKALGCGMSGGWRWHEIEVSGASAVVLSGRLRELASGLGVSRILVSHGSFADHAVALVLLEG
jgi:holo-[acyl-carrier protein] synthase